MSDGADTLTVSELVAMKERDDVRAAGLVLLSLFKGLFDPTLPKPTHDEVWAAAKFLEAK